MTPIPVPIMGKMFATLHEQESKDRASPYRVFGVKAMIADRYNTTTTIQFNRI